MSDLELILDECLTQLVSGASSLDEILARYPEHATQLKPLLQTAVQFESTQSLKPSPVFKARARGQLTNYMKAHPRRQSWMMMPIGRVAMSAAVLVIALFITGTVFAQSALPGQTLYEWKLSSENIWRAVALNPVSVDLTLGDRRVNEMIAVNGNFVEEAQALNGYLEVLARLKSEGDARNSAQILQVLKLQKEKLSRSGISIPQLNQILSPSSANPSLPGIVPTRPNLLPPDLPSLLPKVIPTLKIPSLLP